MNHLYIHLPYKKLIENIELVRKRNLDLEIYLNADILDAVTKTDIERLKGYLDYSPSITFHAPFIDLSPGGVDRLVREVTLKRFLQLIDIAFTMKPEAIVFHPGFDKWRFDGHEYEWLTHSTQTWSIILEKTEPLGCVIAIENIFEEDPSTLEDLVNHIPSERFGICFDIGHFNIFSKADMREWVRRLGNQFKELHLHDNNGKFDDHLAPGDGNIDFQGFFKMLRETSADPLITIEAHNIEAIDRSIAKMPELLAILE